MLFYRLLATVLVVSSIETISFLSSNNNRFKLAASDMVQVALANGWRSKLFGDGWHHIKYILRCHNVEMSRINKGRYGVQHL